MNLELAVSSVPSKHTYYLYREYTFMILAHISISSMHHTGTHIAYSSTFYLKQHTNYLRQPHTNIPIAVTPTRYSSVKTWLIAVAAEAMVTAHVHYLWQTNCPFLNYLPITCLNGNSQALLITKLLVTVAQECYLL